MVSFIIFSEFLVFAEFVFIFFFFFFLYRLTLASMEEIPQEVCLSDFEIYIRHSEKHFGQSGGNQKCNANIF